MSTRLVQVGRVLPRRIPWLSGLAIAWLTMACATAPKSGETLMESLRTYHEGMRWQRFAAAAGRLPAAERSAFVDEWDERSADLKITDYEIVDVALRNHGTALVQVKVSWYGETEGTLRDTHVRQTWKQRGKMWLLTDEVRVRGTAMPGLVEPMPAAGVAVAK
jgi:hypothetical protein